MANRKTIRKWFGVACWKPFSFGCLHPRLAALRGLADSGRGDARGADRSGEVPPLRDLPEKGGSEGLKTGV
jgi:hypothetical protein